jgi:PEGA domain-containing protein
MKTVLRRIWGPSLRSGWMLLVLSSLLLAPAIYAAENEVLGKIDFSGKSHVERTSGVWIDGQYVGYLKELKNTRQVMLLPGDHVITVRQAGYQDFTTTVQVQPGQTKHVRVAMTKAETLPLPAEKAEVKIDATPERAAVFVDGKFAGHVTEFKGPGRGMLLAPGAHHIEIALPGYQTFATDIQPAGKQKVEIKTALVSSDAPLAGPLLEKELNAPEPGAMAAPPAK